MSGDLILMVEISIVLRILDNYAFVVGQLKSLASADQFSPEKSKEN